MNSDHIFNPTILREYDIRGIFEDTLNIEDAYALGQILGSKIIEQGGKKISLGYDGRKSSPLLSEYLIEGFVSVGIDVVSIGCGPTPMLYFSTYFLNTDGGVVITGSHNPSNYNGFKITIGGKPFFGEDIQKLSKKALEYNPKVVKGSRSKRKIDKDYINRIMQNFVGNQKLIVVWDPGNGSAGEIVQQIVKCLPGTHYVINSEIDGDFPNHHPDPTKIENLIQIKNIIKKKNADFGFAFDGDGDRLVVINCNGEVIPGDQLLLIFSESVLISNPGASIIADVKSSQVLFDQISFLGGKPIMYKTGHSNIKEKMYQTGALLAGEMSGHIFFADKYYGYDDAIYAAIRFLSIFSSQPESLSERIRRFPEIYNTPEIRFYCDDNKKFEVINEIRNRVLKTAFEVIDIDGLRVQMENGWWLLRASNTEPALVARCEANSKDNLDEVLSFLSNELSLSNYLLPYEMI
jgi:phosphomannomutase